MNKNLRHFFLKPVTAALMLLSVGACQTVQTTESGVVGVDRKQRMIVPSEQIEQASQQAYAKLMDDARSKGVLNREPSQVARVNNIAQRVIAQSGAFRPNARDWRWEVNVLTSPEVNAWVMPGGKMAIYTGLIEKLQLSDDELAAVIGHEMAHALREHSRERASEQAVAGIGISVLAAAAGIGDLGQKGMEYAYQGFLGLPNSRRHETEADRIGVEIAARAGYNPQAAVTLWQKMGTQGGATPPKFLSTHPPREDRLNDLRDYAQRVMPLYEQARRR